MQQCFRSPRSRSLGRAASWKDAGATAAQTPTKSFLSPPSLSHLMSRRPQWTLRAVDRDVRLRQREPRIGHAGVMLKRSSRTTSRHHWAVMYANRTHPFVTSPLLFQIRADRPTSVLHNSRQERIITKISTRGKGIKKSDGMFTICLFACPPVNSSKKKSIHISPHSHLTSPIAQMSQEDEPGAPWGLSAHCDEQCRNAAIR
jgi:hypothetical protein